MKRHPSARRVCRHVGEVGHWLGQHILDHLGKVMLGIRLGVSGALAGDGAALREKSGCGVGTRYGLGHFVLSFRLAKNRVRSSVFPLLVRLPCSPTRVSGGAFLFLQEALMSRIDLFHPKEQALMSR